jgi:transcriptional regulator with XRE-family HTH domain
MGKASLSRPARLAEKLLSIRNARNLSQNGLIRWLNLKDGLTQAEISAFERGVRIPPLLVLLRYARKSNINIEFLIDDELDLPL